MAISKTLPFDNADNYNFDSSLVELSAGSAQLKAPISTTNPTIKSKDNIQITELVSIAESVTETGSDEIRYTLEIDGVENYWDGSAWSDSSGYAQSNEVSDINTNASALTFTDTSRLRLVAYLHSDTGATTPSIEDLTINYNYEPTISEIDTCIITGNVIDMFGDGSEGIIINIKAVNYNNEFLESENILLDRNVKQVETNSSGDFSFELIRSSAITDKVYYKIQFKNSNRIFLNKTYEIPDLDNADFDNLTEVDL
jgi:hypothetical protein